MSFALTTEQILRRTKTVTRRMGWLTLEAGDRVYAIEKGQGLKKGEHVKKLALLRIVGVRREALYCMTQDVEYGLEECRREGFGDHPTLRFPSQFVEMFCATHRGCTPASVVTRIEFAYVGEP